MQNASIFTSDLRLWTVCPHTHTLEEKIIKEHALLKVGIFDI